jgi:hypothetical protein
MKNKQITFLTRDGKKIAFDKDILAEIALPNLETPKGFVNIRIKNNRIQKDFFEDMLC